MYYVSTMNLLHIKVVENVLVWELNVAKAFKNGNCIVIVGYFKSKFNGLIYSVSYFKKAFGRKFL